MSLFRSSNLPYMLSVLVLTTALGTWPAALLAQERMFQMTEQQFNSWIFESNGFNSGQGQTGRQRVEVSLTARCQQLDATAHLDELQREKLRLAGQYDIQRFFNDVDAARRQTSMGQISQEELNRIYQSVQPLSQRFQMGLNGRGSLFEKTIRTTLTEEQLAIYEAQELERDRRRYESLVRGSIAMLELSMPLTQKQREKVISLMMEESPPTLTFGNSYYQLLIPIRHMSRIPDKKLRTVFNDVEMNVLKDLFRKTQVYDQILEQQGVFLVDE
ncbi:MAG: hypothetical protein R3C18_11395 [Planctomycetaceae bacterium]